MSDPWGNATRADLWKIIQELRGDWREMAAESGARIHVLEVELADARELMADVFQRWESDTLLFAMIGRKGN